MAFKMNSAPYAVDNTPIYNVSMEDGVLGKANNNGTIIIDENLSAAQMQGVIDHG